MTTAPRQTLAAHVALSVLLLVLCAPLPLARGELPADLVAKANGGDVAAQYQIAQRYATGNDVPRDDSQALNWYLKAAQRDYAPAEVALGSIYSHGFGVKQDWGESIRWFRQAALQGDPVALHNLGLDYEHAHGVAKDDAQAAVYYRLGAQQGQPRCQYNLARLCEDGRGVPKDLAQACLLQSLAADHENPVRIFGEAKAKEVVERRDNLKKSLTPDQLDALPRQIKAYQASVAVHPRRFGTAPTGMNARGWYIWHSYNPETGEVVLSSDNPAKPTAETFTARVLPWITTYRHLTYGVRPDTLLPGERVNVFFDADENDRRGYASHFQDEICQMKGHGHFWQIKTVHAANNKFTASVMAGEKPLNPADPDREFVIDPKCAKWREGKQVDTFPLASGDHVYTTWVLRDNHPTVVILSDAASLDALKKIESERLAKELAITGMAGQLQTLNADGNPDTAHLMIFSNHWNQANQLKEGQAVIVFASDKANAAISARISGKITFRKNRGTYGSGVNDILVKLAGPQDIAVAAPLQGGATVRLIPTP